MFHGSMVAMVTPMFADGSIDYMSLRKLVDWHIKSGTNAIVTTATTGESPTLKHEEKIAFLRHVVEQVAERIPVIASTGTNCTEQTIELTREAMEVGADACMLVTPYYNKPTQEGLYQHYRAVADAVPIPQILYNIPGRTGCNMLPETVARLASISNIIGIKEGNVAAAKDIIRLCGSHFDVYSGDDDTALEIILAGGKGVISVAANILPKMLHDLCKAAIDRDAQLATNINESVMPLYKQLFIESNPIPVKWIMHEMGLIPQGIRLPLTWLAQKYEAGIKEVMLQVGISK